MDIKKRLEYLRGEIRNECISYGEIAELQSLKEHIEDGDVELLQWAEEISCTYCNLDRPEKDNKLIDIGDGEYVCELCIKCEGLTVDN